ncbi:LysR family transcriptional regulator [uncultured Xylophilus sp.]|uniref:LysR family transcriptional regulator n=1 Tax=uncultured Xylophilus sp. TaxID=296832 RepID=UPI0025CF135F|nr:LysR family transcriptional regulator [uncultured Xylophilus sp.]
MRDIDPVSLRLFLATLEEGSIARAAARESIVPSAISKRLSDLEDDLRVTLLERGVKGVHPTPAGDALAQHARQLLQGMDRMQREMAGYVDGLRGLIRLAASVTALSGELASDILRFRGLQPQIAIDVEERTTPAVYRSVRDGLADVGVASEFASHDGLQMFPYRRYALAAVLPAAHPLAARPHLAYAELLAHDQVELGRDSGISRVFDDAAHEARTTRTVRARVGSFETVCTLVARGLGVGVAPLYLQAAKESALGLRFVPLADGWARPRTFVAVRDLDALPPAARAFVAHLRASAPADADNAAAGAPAAAP